MQKWTVWEILGAEVFLASECDRLSLCQYSVADAASAAVSANVARVLVG